MAYADDCIIRYEPADVSDLIRADLVRRNIDPARALGVQVTTTQQAFASGEFFSSETPGLTVILQPVK